MQQTKAISGKPKGIKRTGKHRDGEQPERGAFSSDWNLDRCFEPRIDAARAELVAFANHSRSDVFHHVRRRSNNAVFIKLTN
jgi:hypothetical protein